MLRPGGGSRSEAAELHFLGQLLYGPKKKKVCEQTLQAVDCRKGKGGKNVLYSIRKLQMFYFGIKSPNLSAQHSRDNRPLGLVLESSDQQTVEREENRRRQRGISAWHLEADVSSLEQKKKKRE